MQPFCKPNRWLCTGVAASIGVEEKDQRASVREQMGKDAYDEGHDDEDGRAIVQGEPALVQASMSQVEMTVWLCVMALMASGMLALLALVSR